MRAACARGCLPATGASRSVARVTALLHGPLPLFIAQAILIIGLSRAICMGAAMSITACPVLARILVERRLLKTKLGAMAITCAAVDDVTAWCILAFVVSIVRVTSLAGAVSTTLLTLAYIAAMLAVVRPFVRRLASRSANREGLNQNVVAVTLMLVLLSSWATEWIGIHALFGAFIFGAVVPKEDRFAQILADKLEDLVVVLR